MLGAYNRYQPVSERFPANNQKRKIMTAAEFLQTFIETLRAHLERYPDLQPLLKQMELALAEPPGKGRKRLIRAAFTMVPEIDLPASGEVMDLFCSFHVSVIEAHELASKEAGDQDNEMDIQQLRLYEG